MVITIRKTPFIPIALVMTSFLPILPSIALPGPSHPGGKIAFRSHVTGNSELFTLDMTAKIPKPVQITHKIAISGQKIEDFTFSAEGTRLAFAVIPVEGGATGQIYVVNADGSHPHKLTASGTLNRQPSWSPDGKQIAFSCNSDANANTDGNPAEICVVNALGGTTKTLTRVDTIEANPGPGKTDPAWSPDGTHIAYDESTGMQVTLIVMNSDGSHSTFTGGPDFGGSPVWSPDNTRLAFAAINANAVWDVGLDGNHLTKLSYIHNPGGTDVSFDGNQLSWSPDGQHIAFTTGTAQSQSEGDIYVVDPDGSHLLNLTKNSVFDPIRSNFIQPSGSIPSSNYSPVWSPDSQQIAFISDRDGNGDIYLMNVDGSAISRLTFGSTVDCCTIVWSTK